MDFYCLMGQNRNEKRTKFVQNHGFLIRKVVRRWLPSSRSFFVQNANRTNFGKSSSLYKPRTLVVTQFPTDDASQTPLKVKFSLDHRNVVTDTMNGNSRCATASSKAIVRQDPKKRYSNSASLGGGMAINENWVKVINWFNKIEDVPKIDCYFERF